MSLVRPADAVVVALAALLVGAAWASLWRGDEPAEFVQLSVPGAPDERLALSVDQVREVRGRIGTSRLEVRDGRVRFTDSPCVGRYCVHAGWLSRSGQVAACLPNGVVIEVTGGERQYDAVSF